MCLKGSKHLGYPPLLSQTHQQQAGLEVEQPGLELVSLWDAGPAAGAQPASVEHLMSQV